MHYRVSRSGWSGRPEIEIVRIEAAPDDPAAREEQDRVAPAELAVAT
jgi:hypothetical protein